jgi:hypothetical protein
MRSSTRLAAAGDRPFWADPVCAITSSFSTAGRPDRHAAILDRQRVRHYGPVVRGGQEE